MSYGETLGRTQSCTVSREPDVQSLLKWVDELVTHDEPILALKALELLPSRLRDNPGPEIIKTKRLIKKLLVTSVDTVGEKFIPPMESLTGDEIKGSLRGRLVLEDAKKHPCRIVEFAPGNFWIPIGLIKEEVAFNYKPICLHQDKVEKFYGWHGIALKTVKEFSEIFVAHEIIEHLWDETELEKQQLLHAPNAEVIHISTPEYNFFSHEDPTYWKRSEGLLHYRAYTPGEFIKWAENTWPEFFWQMYSGQPMSIRGVRHGYERKWI